MANITISGRKIQLSDALKNYATEKIGNALKFFDINPMKCDIVLRVDRNRANPDRKTCEVTIHVRDSVVRVSESDTDMYASIDLASEKVERQLRKYKTRLIDKRQRKQKIQPAATIEDLEKLIIPEDEDKDDLLVREKTVTLIPMSEDKALVETDLLGHDFYMFLNANSGQINVIYHRKNGGYGILKPKIEDVDEH